MIWVTASDLALSHNLVHPQLVSLKFNDNPLVEEVDVFTGEEVLQQNVGSIGTLVFVVRRPG